MRFDYLRHISLFVIKYQAGFYPLSKHVIALIIYELERFHRLMRRLSFSIRSYVLKVTYEKDSFWSILSTTKKEKLMVQDELWILRGLVILVSLFVPHLRKRVDTHVVVLPNVMDLYMYLCQR